MIDPIGPEDAAELVKRWRREHFHTMGTMTFENVLVGMIERHTQAAVEREWVELQEAVERAMAQAYEDPAEYRRLIRAAFRHRAIQAAIRQRARAEHDAD